MGDGEGHVEHTRARRQSAHLAIECNPRKLLGVTASRRGGHGRPEVDERRLQLKWISASEGAAFAEEIRFFVELLKELGGISIEN